jgi:hypothetical protein
MHSRNSPQLRYNPAAVDVSLFAFFNLNFNAYSNLRAEIQYAVAAVAKPVCQLGQHRVHILLKQSKGSLLF